ncbi:adhesion G protein-coupled receptor E2-like [Anoplolepis gracilipes]|uniref:adhesion G protein-coupled receptor E2-like n=1 Tax=Anoplolepis gracilipes TaxID=354296 RepID=UPI003B9EEB2C
MLNRFHEGQEQQMCLTVQECEDIDEYLRSLCGHSAIYTNVYGSFRCSCLEGMNGDPLSSCHDPCDGFLCGINVKCTPSDPPRCVCEAGFEGDPQQGCVDLNECANNPCSNDVYCINTIGDHVCECPKDMTGDPYGAGCTGVVTD